MVLARDGKIYVAWFSDRGNNPDIYIARSDNGSSWTPPVRVTTSAGGDFHPTLYQDEQGVFHLSWFRWTALFSGYIMYNSSADGLTWNTADEVQVTNVPAVDDWMPVMTQAADGTLLIYFVSQLRNGAVGTSDLYVAARRTGQVAWDPAVKLAVSSATEHDDLPFVGRTGADITLVWTRHDTTQKLPWLNPKSDVYCATSRDGFNWSAVKQVTSDAGNVVNLYPAFFRSSGAGWSLIWLSNRAGAPRVYELPFTDCAQIAGAGQQNTEMPDGYSHRILPTATPGRYLAAWVSGPEGMQDIYWRLLTR